jgi:hypothetical protein
MQQVERGGHSNAISLSDAAGTGLRLFVPSVAGHDDARLLLPLVLYFQGGRYVLFYAASEPFHNTCAALAAAAPVIVAFVDYRLAPEHRLPAAFEDAADTVLWARPHAAVVRPVFMMGKPQQGQHRVPRRAGRGRRRRGDAQGRPQPAPSWRCAERTLVEAASVDDSVLLLLSPRPFPCLNPRPPARGSLLPPLAG